MVSVWEELGVKTKVNKKSKRVGRGRGSGKGKYAGRGMDGQSKRSGAKVKPHFEGGQRPMVLRTPMIRGKRFRGITSGPEVLTINIKDISGMGTEIDLTAVLSLKKGQKSKLLGDGEVNTKLTVKSHFFSNPARQKIESAGGECVVICGF
jgi:large subunit ribosomal protein L15